MSVPVGPDTGRKISSRDPIDRSTSGGRADVADLPGRAPGNHFTAGQSLTDRARQDLVAGGPVPIPAGRLLLRPVRRSDAGLFAVYAGDVRVARATRSIPHPLPPGAADAFVTRAVTPGGSEDVWVMDASASGLPEVLGVMSLRRIDRGQSEIGYWVAPAFWNEGFASEALAALIEANPQANCTIFAEVFQDNPGSARVLTNCGFDYLGDAESFSVARNARVPTWTYLKRMG